jgi:predicted porin
MDYSVGASYDLGSGMTLSGAYVGANKKNNYLFAVDQNKSVNKGTVVVMLTKTL